MIVIMSKLFYSGPIFRSHQICGGKDQELGINDIALIYSGFYPVGRGGDAMAMCMHVLLAAAPPGPKRQRLTSKLPHSVIMCKCLYSLQCTLSLI